MVQALTRPACGNAHCRDGVCYGPHAPAPHPCKACLRRADALVLEAVKLVGDTEMLVIAEGATPASRKLLRIAHVLLAAAQSKRRQLHARRPS